MMISCAFLWWLIWYYVDVKYNDTSCYVIRSNLLCSFCFLLPFSFFLILSLSLCLSVRLTSSFVSARRLLLFFFSLSAEEEVENFDVSSLQEEVLRNIEADSFWCMSKLLDGIQVNWFPVRRIPGLLKPTVCVCVCVNARAEGCTAGRENSVCVLCASVCVSVSPAYSSSAARIPGVTVFSLILSLLLGPLSRNETDDEYSLSAPWAEATCLPKRPGGAPIAMGTWSALPRFVFVFSVYVIDLKLGNINVAQVVMTQRVKPCAHSSMWLVAAGKTLALPLLPRNQWECPMRFTLSVFIWLFSSLMKDCVITPAWERETESFSQTHGFGSHTRTHAHT